jgi:hypothetical protein
MKKIKNIVKDLNKKKIAGSITYLDLVVIISIIFSSFFLRFYNASDLSGGDDSQFAQLTAFTFEDPLKLLYPSHLAAGRLWFSFSFRKYSCSKVDALWKKLD